MECGGFLGLFSDFSWLSGFEGGVALNRPFKCFLQSTIKLKQRIRPQNFEWSI
jgi:hypothetical protein